MILEKFKAKIKERKAKVGVIGLGYVGLPLAVAFAKKGFSVTGIDIDRTKVSRLNRGLSYILDVPSKDLKAVVGQRRFRATDDYRALSQLDAVIICVPTPLSKTKEPDISYVIEATKKIADFLKKGQLVVLESTTYPGTTEEVMLPLLEKAGLQAERDFFLAFSPERVDPGNQQYDTISIPKVVGGTGRFSTQAAKALYGSVMQRIVEVSSAKTAEMVKLLENTFRSVNIGLINEIALMSSRLGVDIWEVIEAAKTKPFGFMPFYPGPGIGGHCLPIDPLYLSWKSRLHGFEAKMIELASDINKSMPAHVVDRLGHLLNQKRIPLKKAQVLVLGMSYKRDIDDPRESPAVDVVELLLEKGSEVFYSDPFIPSFRIHGKVLRSQRLTPQFLRRMNGVVVLTDHSSFDYAAVVKHSKLILDTRNVLRKFNPKETLFFL